MFLGTESDKVLKASFPCLIPYIAFIHRTLIIATGLSTPNIPKVEGIELAKGYESVSIDPEDYEAKTVLILGEIL